MKIDPEDGARIADALMLLALLEARASMNPPVDGADAAVRTLAGFLVRDVRARERKVGLR